MIYTVAWKQEALDKLALIWMRAHDRQAVSDAANRIDRELRVDPDRKGRRRGKRRVYTDLPLLVVYEVIPDDGLVRVLGFVHQ